MASGPGSRSILREAQRPSYHPYARPEQYGSHVTRSEHVSSSSSAMPLQYSYPYQQSSFSSHLSDHRSPDSAPMYASPMAKDPLSPGNRFSMQTQQQQQRMHSGPSSGSQHTFGGVSSATTSTESRKAIGSESGTIKPQYSSRATIVIIGMKGAGKTTLGLIASRTLGRTFVDTDHLFRTSENASLESFVAAHGWNAFRARETAILKDVLARCPHDAVVACGGGIIESHEARKALQAARSTYPIIQVLREEDAIHRYVQGRWLRQYDEELDAMIKRRASLYRKCCSHTFFNLTCADDSMAESKTVATRIGRSTPVGAPAQIHPLKFKQVGDSFMRLLHCILGDVRQASVRQMSHSASMSTASSSALPPSSKPVRNKISYLLASHGPGPDVAIERRAAVRPIDSPPPQKLHTTSQPSHSTSGSQFVLPMRANVLDRSSLLTRRTTAVSLTFPDLSVIEPEMIQKITQGVDAVEVRIDMLDCMKPASALARSSHPEREPLIEYEEVARQMETLRRVVPGLPILFTLRSDREGGFFYDDRKLAQRDTASPHSQAIYFFLLEMAIGMGVELLDVELGWDPMMTKKLVEARGRTRIVPSYHDLMGALKWDSNVPHQLYERACSFGSGVHVVMMIGTTSRAAIEQNSYISAFSARMLSAAAADPRKRLPPLMALNMGLAGRSSRPFNNVLNFVSHPVMSIKAGRGQFSLKEMMETLVRLSVIRTSHFHLYGPTNGQARLTKMAIQAAFDEFGLPYTLLDEGTWNLNEYIAVHQREDVPDRDDEDTSFNSMSDGMCIVGQAHRQADLFHIMESRSPHRLSIFSRVVQAVDVLAREDMALTLLGTEKGRHAPSSLGEMRGPLVGCHSLPAAIYRVLSSHLAPINAPNMQRSGLIVVLDDVDKEQGAQANTVIAKRAAVFAMLKLGFGTVYIVDEVSHKARSREPQSRRASATPNGSRDTSVPPFDQQESWSNEILQLAHASSYRLFQDFGGCENRGMEGDRGGESEGQEHVSSAEDVHSPLRHVVKHIGLRGLSHHSNVQGGGHWTMATGSSESTRNGLNEYEDPQTAVTMQEFERHPSKKPCAIAIVGGTEQQQEHVMRLLWSPKSESGGLGDADHVGSSESSHSFTLPKDVWESSFGGTVIRIPSTRSSPIGARRQQQLTQREEEHLRTSHRSYPGAIWERGGWIHVEPWVLDRDRIQRTVVEAWTRRSAPVQHMHTVWDGGEVK